MAKINWSDREAKKVYDRGYAAARRKDKPMAIREACRRYRERHHRPKQAKELTSLHHSIAHKRSWEERKASPAWAATQREKQLKQDLKLLDRVVRGIESRLRQKEKNRAQALAQYHKRATVLNLRRRLPGLYRTALRGQAQEEKEKAQRPSLLERAYRRVLSRQSSAVEAKLIRRLRTRFEKAMKAKASSPVILELCGTSLVGLRGHLQSSFVLGMSWSNHGWGPGKWNIDHVRPLASFDLTDPAQRRAAFHYSNLQPLWHEDNMKKRDTWA